MRIQRTFLPLGEGATDRQHVALRTAEHLFDRRECHVVGTALAIGLGVAGAVSSVAGGLVAKKGADNAAAATLTATREANAESKRQFDIGQQNLQPWVGAGAAAEGRLSYLLGLSPVVGNSSKSFTQNYGPMGGAPAGTTPAASPSASRAATLQQLSGGGPVAIREPQPGYDLPPMAGETMSNIPDYAGALDPLWAGAHPLVKMTAGNNDPNIGGPAKRGTFDVAPGGTTGTGSTTPNDGQFGSLMHDFSATDFQTDPGYLFRLSEGQKALDRSASAQGGMFSGAALKANDRYNQDFASNEFSNAYGRYQSNRQTKYNFLAGLSGNGQGTAQFGASLGADYARTVGGNTIAGANAAAQARASGYNALAGSIATLPGTAYGAYDSFKRG